MTTKHRRPIAHIVNHEDYELLRRPAHRVDVRAKELRLKKIFGNGQLKGNPVVEGRR